MSSRAGTRSTSSREQPNRALQSARVFPERRAAEPTPLSLLRSAQDSHGAPLDAATQQTMAARFGHDFGRVRVHTDGQAAELARALEANAVTRGQDIYFAAGQFQPGTPQGQRLLAHELAHTIQQRHQAALQPSLVVSQPGDRHEVVADAVAADVVAGRQVVPGRIAPAAAGSLNVIARQPATITPERPTRSPNLLDPARMLDALAATILRNLQADPSDRSGRVRRQLQRLAPSTRESVLQRLQLRMTASQWDQLTALLDTAPPEGSELATPATEPGAEAPETSVQQEAAEPTTAPPPAEAPAAESPAAELPQPDTAQTAVAETEAPPGEVKTPPKPDELPETSEPGPAVPNVDASQAEAAATKQGQAAPEAGAPEKPAARTSAAAPPAIPGAEAVPEPPGTAVDEGPAEEAPNVEGEAPEGGESAPPEAESAEVAGPAEAPATEPEQAPQGPQPTLEQADAVAAPPSEVSDEPAPAAAEEPVGPVSTDESSSPPPDTPPVPLRAQDEPDAAPPPPAAEPEPAPPATVEASAEPLSRSATAPEAMAEPPEADGAAPVEETTTATPVGPAAADGAATETEAAQGEVPSVSDGAAAPADGAAPADAAAPADGAAAPVEVRTTPDPPDPACGGGGSPIPEPEQPEPPNVAQADPAQAMQAVGNLPPAQLQVALGSVSQSASSEVNAERQDLTANPPQMERPSGVPANRDASMPPAQLPPPPPDLSPKQVDKTPAGEAVPVPGPPPLPAPPPSPTQGTVTPRLPGEAQITEQDARQVQDAVSSLPTTDPALNVTAGEAPKLKLEGDADPARARQQREQMNASVLANEEQGYKDVTEPAGENNVFPHVPKETLKADIGANGATPGAGSPTGPAAPAGAAPGPAAPAPAAAAPAPAAAAPGEAPGAAGGGGGEGGGADQRSISLIAQEQRGDQIRAAVNKGRADIVAKKQEHATQVADERTKSQKDIDDLVNKNADEQSKARDKVRRDVQAQRVVWSDEQRKLVDGAKTEADDAGRKGEEDLTREHNEADAKSAEHIDQGNQEIADARRDGEEKARREKEKADKESSDGGFFSWLGSKVTSFFNRIKDAIHSVFEFARKAVRAAIERVQRLAMAVIEVARKAIVGIIQKVGDALIAIGDRVLAGFPNLRDRFRRAIQNRVKQATDAVNKLADDLKAGVKAALDALGKALNGFLNLLEKAYTAAIDFVANAVKSAIDFAKAVVQALAVFGVLIRDIAASPGQWLSNLGTAIVDGIRNCLWAAFKRAIKEWFNQKVEEVLGLGLAVWNLLKKGGLSIAMIGTMAWEGIKAAIPPTLAQILVEKLVAMIVPAAGAILTIIEGLRAAWGTVSRIISAFQLFFAFLKAVKTGGPSAAGKFANALAAAAIVVIDFVANWLIARLGKAAGAVAGRLGKLAGRIGAGLKRVGRVARRGVAAIGRGVRAVGRGIARGARAVGRGVARAGRAIAGSRVGQAIARSRVGRAFGRGVQRVRGAIQNARQRFQNWRERRRQRRDPNGSPAERARVETLVRGLVEIADQRNTPARTLLRRLNRLRRRYRWIKDFEAQPKGDEGQYAIFMIASRITIKSNYTEQDVAGPAFIDYRSVDSLGRPTGIDARIKRPIKPGTAANPSIRPPGFLGGASNHARGHLLGRQLGGSGDDRRNLVTLIHIPVNTPIMRGFENQVRAVVERREAVLYTVVPNYKGNQLMPTSVTIRAIGSKQFRFVIVIPNHV